MAIPVRSGEITDVGAFVDAVYTHMGYVEGPKDEFFLDVLGKCTLKGPGSPSCSICLRRRWSSSPGMR